MSEKAKTGLKFLLTAIFSLAAGIIIFWIDSSTGWDDTGVTVGLILVSSIAAGFLYPRNMWLWALLIGIWLPLANIIKHGDIKFLVILLIPFAGAYAGGLVCRIINRGNMKMNN